MLPRSAEWINVHCFFILNVNELLIDTRNGVAACILGRNLTDRPFSSQFPPPWTARVVHLTGVCGWEFCYRARVICGGDFKLYMSVAVAVCRNEVRNMPAAGHPAYNCGTYSLNRRAFRHLTGTTYHHMVRLYLSQHVGLSTDSDYNNPFYREEDGWGLGRDLELMFSISS
ncbi:unnamed protein product [Acanthocheilonema viteae]|uniref:Uncharacterized protein n=1 Tax=Acanthocheilonema viteae TaxID=6277 RepID=A0A498SM89_ACAVI|nr:unnamed protein product [Acanthocheilonema viteae]